MNEGWIKLHRQTMEHDWYFAERFTKMQAWFDLLLMANHKTNSFFIRGNEVVVNRGQIARSRESLAERWQWNRKTVGYYLIGLEKRQMITQQKTPSTMVITINNYDSYQSDGQQNGQQTTQQKHNRTDINKNDKNGKNVKNNKHSSRDEEFVFSEYKRMSGRERVSLTPKRSKSICARLKDFTSNEIRMAMAQMSTNDFLRGKNEGGKDYFTIDFAMRHDKIEDYLNQYLLENKSI